MLLALGVVTAAVVAALVVLLAGWLLRRAAVAGRWPQVQEPDPDLEPTRGDQVRWVLSIVATLLAGAVGAVVLAWLPPASSPPALLRFAQYADGGWRWLGALFFGLGLMCMLAWPMARWLLDVPALTYFVWQGAGMLRPLDPRPLLRWCGSGLAAASVVLHLGIRIEHTTFDEQGLRWRDWLWQAEHARSWADVQDVLLVATWVAPTGNVREREHLVIRFADGEVLRAGRRDDVAAGFWEAAASLAAERSGRAIRRVERED